MLHTKPFKGARNITEQSHIDYRLLEKPPDRWSEGFYFIRIGRYIDSGYYQRLPLSREKDPLRLSDLGLALDTDMAQPST